MHTLSAPACFCALHSRRQFTRRVAQGAAGASALLAAGPLWAQDGADVGVSKDVGRTSRMAKLVPAATVEGSAQQQYLQMMQGAQQQHALAPANHPQVIRLRAIAARIIPFATPWNERAAQWKWEVNLIGSTQLNAFCMPGGKIAFYYGILQKLQLTDDEVATIMGHEVAHALREHARERMGKSMATRGAIELGSALLGLGGAGHMAANMGGQLLSLKFGRDDETEADIVGMDLAARAGYDPAAGVTLWQKMMAANKGAPPQWMSTHPASDTRIKDIQAKLPKVAGLYAKAPKPETRFGPPVATVASAASGPSPAEPREPRAPREPR
jgi:predicted Zn-dependent protease